MIVNEKLPDRCPACDLIFRKNWGSSWSFRYCESSCLATSSNYVNESSYGHKPQPHVHATCDVCGFQLLVSPANLNECLSLRHGEV